MTLKPIVAGAIVLGAAGALYGAVTFLNAGDSELERQLADMAEAGNAELPMMLDADTRLDSILAESKDRFEYRYTLVNVQASQVDRDAFEQTMAPHLLNFVCTGSSNVVFRTHGMNVVYTYYGNDGGEVASMVIPTSECAA